MSSNIIQKKLRGVVLVFILTLPLLVQSQDSNFGNWMLYIGNKKINAKWNIHHEIQYRNYNSIGNLEQLLLRTGLGYSFNENKNNILLGYGYIRSENYNNGRDLKVSINEHRIFQQFTSKQKISSVNLSHRYRFEQRFVENNFKLRLRYLLGLNIPLTNIKKTENSFYVSVYNEIFLNTKSSIFDRNRLYGGVGYRLNKNVKFEIGYMNQFFETSSRDQLNIISFINF